MGHVHRELDSHTLLQRRLNQTVSGAPDSPAFRELLKLLFAPEDAGLATHLPARFITLRQLSRKLNVDQTKLEERIAKMARRGLVMDLVLDGERYVSLAPVVVGFFEFTFMRTRDGVPLKQVARLFDDYMKQPDGFTHSLFAGTTQICRSLVREEALPDIDHTEILDWERTTQVLRGASQIAVGLCSCRHKAGHLGQACAAPLETCISLNEGAKMLIRNGIARPLPLEEALRLLSACKKAGLAQTADNVQRQITYICNCCGCCCHFFDAIKRFAIRGAVVTSNWIMSINLPSCTGCGRCVQQCPVDAIRLEPGPEGTKEGRHAVVDEGLCLGCGVCYAACPRGAIRLQPRPQRVFTPETMFDRVVLMAIERGKLADLLFEEPEQLSMRALKRVVYAIEQANLLQAAVAIKPLRSVFLNTMVSMAKRTSGQVGRVFG